MGKPIKGSRTVEVSTSTMVRAVASRVLRYAYEMHDRESDRLKTLIVLEEAHSFLPENVSPDAKGEAVEVRNWIDRISREMRKYGLNLLLITQSLSDFRREARIVREATNTKFFMRATELITSHLRWRRLLRGWAPVRLFW